MVTQNMLRAREGNRSYQRKDPIGDFSRSNKMPETDQVTDIVPYVRTDFQLPSNLGTMS